MSYVREVSELFQNRCNVTILSPEDYTLIAEWEKQEIPFAIVAAVIDDICNQPRGCASEIKSISSFQETIKKNFRDWLRMGFNN